MRPRTTPAGICCRFCSSSCWRSGDADDSGEAGGERRALGAPTSTLQTQFVDVREDRMVIYGMAEPHVREYVYRLKATNAGSFLVPAAYAESMYDNAVYARSGGNTLLTVVNPQ